MLVFLCSLMVGYACGLLLDIQEVLQKMLKDYVIQQCRLRSSYAISSTDGIVREQMISKQALQVGFVFATLEFSNQVGPAL